MIRLQNRWASRLVHPVVMACLAIGFLNVLAGCHRWAALEKIPMVTPPPPPVEIPVSNPSHIGPVNPEFLWRQVVDATDDYLRVANEQPVRRDAELWSEGRLTTVPEVSGTSLEPWRRDTSRGFERLQSTFQTIRRTATVRVSPEETGYVIDVTVMKEQEDVDQSQYSTSGSSAQRHDGTIVRTNAELRQLPVTLGWYEIGRDRDLETRILANILGRIHNVEPPKRRLLEH